MLEGNVLLDAIMGVVHFRGLRRYRARRETDKTRKPKPIRAQDRIPSPPVSSL